MDTIPLLLAGLGVLAALVLCMGVALMMMARRTNTDDITDTLEALEEKVMKTHVVLETQQQDQIYLREALDKKFHDFKATTQGELERLNQQVRQEVATNLGHANQELRTQLERVAQNLGEMTSVAERVKSMQQIFSNVKTRGIFGELTLESMLSTVLAPSQYWVQAPLYGDNRTKVDFAIRVPDHEHVLYMPMDAKFPLDRFEAVNAALDEGDSTKIQKARQALWSAVKDNAKSIRDLYIKPPITTDFAVMYLPSEALYSEVLLHPNGIEELQREFHVMVVGPTVAMALLNSLNTGWLSYQLVANSGQVRLAFDTVRTAFDEFSKQYDSVNKSLAAAQKQLLQLDKCRLEMEKALASIQSLSTHVEVPSLKETTPTLGETLEPMPTPSWTETPTAYASRAIEPAIATPLVRTSEPDLPPLPL